MRLASRSVTLIVGLVVLVGLGLAVYLSLTASSGLPGQSFRIFSVDFDNVGDLRDGDDVRSASVRIGQVRDITYQDNKARVEVQVDPGQQIYRDAKAAVVERSALGQNFVMVSPGSPSAGALPQDGRLSDSGISSPVELDQVLSVLDAPTRKATGSTIKEVGTGLAGHSQDLADALTAAPALVHDLQTVAASLAAPDADLTGLLQTSDRLAQRFNGRTEHIGRLVRQTRQTVRAVAVDGGVPLGDTLDDAPGTLQDARIALRGLRTPLDDLGTSMHTLLPGATALGRSTPDLRHVLRDGVVPLGKVPGVAKDSSPAVSNLTTAVRDARPLATRLQKTVSASDHTTAVLAPYTPEIVRFFQYWTSANQYSDKSGHYLRITLLVRPETLDGIVPSRDPLVHRDPYPAPGQAENDRATTILGGN